jgi:hypothetical protein
VICGACLGLHTLANHTHELCPLLKAAKRGCDCEDQVCPWEAPLCSRKLFSLLLSLQLYDGLITLPQTADRSSVRVVADFHGLHQRFWAPEVPQRAFELYVTLSDDTMTKFPDELVLRIPIPTRWIMHEPFGFELEVEKVEGSFRIREVLPPFPLLVPVDSMFIALSWRDFLKHVICGDVICLKRGQLINAIYRQSPVSSIAIPGGAYSRWSPVFVHPRRGFLMQKGERHRWKAFHQLAAEKIAAYETQLRHQSNSKSHGHMIAMIEGKEESADEFRGSVRRVPVLPQLSSSTARLYSAFSRGMVESDGEDEGSTDNTDNEMQAPDATANPAWSGLVPAGSEVTATGAYRDNLAQFAAQFAEQQKQQHVHPPNRRKARPKVEATDRTQGNLVWLGVTNKWKKATLRLCPCRGVYVIPLLAIVAVVMALVGAALGSEKRTFLVLFWLTNCF